MQTADNIYIAVQTGAMSSSQFKRWVRKQLRRDRHRRRSALHS